MIFTKAWLLQNKDKTGVYPQASVKQHGRYTTKYGVHYHKATDSYRIDLTNFGHAEPGMWSPLKA